MQPAVALPCRLGTLPSAPLLRLPSPPWRTCRVPDLGLHHLQHASHVPRARFVPICFWAQLVLRPRAVQPARFPDGAKSAPRREANKKTWPRQCTASFRCAAVPSREASPQPSPALTSKPTPSRLSSASWSQTPRQWWPCCAGQTRCAPGGGRAGGRAGGASKHSRVAKTSVPLRHRSGLMAAAKDNMSLICLGGDPCPKGTRSSSGVLRRACKTSCLQRLRTARLRMLVLPTPESPTSTICGSMGRKQGNGSST